MVTPRLFNGQFTFDHSDEWNHRLQDGLNQGYDGLEDGFNQRNDRL